MIQKITVTEDRYVVTGGQVFYTEQEARYYELYRAIGEIDPDLHTNDEIAIRNFVRHHARELHEALVQFLGVLPKEEL